MDNKNKKQLAIGDLEFSEITAKESEIIKTHRDKILFSGFIKRVYISVVVTAIVMISEYVGRHNSGTEKTIPGAFIAIGLGFVVFNILSFGYMNLKQKMDIYRDHLSFTYGYVDEKYNGNVLEKQNREKSKDYILFDTDKVHCNTAVAISDHMEFLNINLGDKVLIVKSSPYGEDHYEVFTNIEK